MNDNILVADIEGYGAVFHVRDLNGDIIEPGAFAKTLNAKPGIKMLYQHAAETPIGRWTSFTEDANGLFVTGEILLSSARAREVHALLAGGAIDGLSIGYQTVRARKASRASGRRIIEADLWEVSIVTFPMAPGARVTLVGEPRPEHTPRALLPGARGPRRASHPPSEARHFADALRSAASHISTRENNLVQGVNQ